MEDLSHEILLFINGYLIKCYMMNIVPEQHWKRDNAKYVFMNQFIKLSCSLEVIF